MVDELTREVINLIAEHLVIQEEIIEPESKFIEDLGLMPNDLEELYDFFNDVCGLEISAEVIKEIMTVNDLIAFIRVNKDAYLSIMSLS